MTLASLAAPTADQALSTAISPDGGWSKLGGVLLSVLVHLSIVGILFLGLSQEPLLVGGGGGGGAGGGSGTGETEFAVTHMPAPLPLSATPLDAEADPVESLEAPEPLAAQVPRLNEVEFQTEDVSSLAMPNETPPALVTSAASEVAVALPVTEPPSTAAPPAVAPPPAAQPTAPPLPLTQQSPTLELITLDAQPSAVSPQAEPPAEVAAIPSELYAFDTPSALKLQASKPEQVEETETKPEALLILDATDEVDASEPSAMRPAAAESETQSLPEVDPETMTARAPVDQPFAEEAVPDEPTPQELEVEPVVNTAHEQIQPEPLLEALVGQEMPETEVLQDAEQLAQPMAPAELVTPEPREAALEVMDVSDPEPLFAMAPTTLEVAEPDATVPKQLPLEQLKQQPELHETEIALLPVPEPTAEKNEKSLTIPLSKPKRQVTLPKVERQSAAKPKQAVAPKPSKTLDEPQVAARSEPETQTGAQVDSAGQGQSTRSGGDQSGGRPGAGGQGSAGAGAGPSGAELNTYAGQLAAWLERHKRYPRSARRRGEQGTVTLRFTLDANGRVLSRRIVRSSGHQRLDREVLALLDRASPMPRPPGNATKFSLAVPIVFSLR